MNGRPIVLLTAAAVTLTVMAGATDAQTAGRYVPKGAYIMMPATSECPAGFVANATLNAGRFPRGGTIPATGGDYEHDHYLPEHVHRMPSETAEAHYDSNGGVLFPVPRAGEYATGHYHNMQTNSSYNLPQRAWPGNNLPPYATVRFCQAQ